MNRGRRNVKSKITLILALAVFLNVTLFARELGGGRGQNQDEAPAFDKVTPEIPGVVKAGTKIEIIKSGLRGSAGGVGMPDGSVLVSTQASAPGQSRSDLRLGVGDILGTPGDISN